MSDYKKLYYSCFYSFFYCGIVMLTLGSALPDMSAAYNLSHSVSGALLSFYSLGNLASGIIIGTISLYLGQKISILLLSSLVFIGMTTLSFTNVPLILFAAFALTGLGRGSMITFSQRTINIFTNGNPKATGILHATFAVGAISAPLLFSALRLISWRAGIIFVALGGLFAVMIFFSIKDYSKLETKKDDNNTGTEKSLAFFKNSGFIIVACLMFLYLCAEFAVNGWLVTYMHHKNMPVSYGHSMAALLWVVMLTGRLICVWLAKYFSQKKILFVLSAGSALSFALMLISEKSFAITGSVALLGLCMSGISPIIYASSAPYTNKYPLAMGYLFTTGCVGGTLMPLITGFIAEIYGFDGGMSAILIAFILLIIFSFINLKRSGDNA